MNVNGSELSGDVSGSSINVNGMMKATSFSSTDVVAINFGSEAKPLDYALEFVYGQAFNAEWDVDGYYEIEIKDAKTNAYINNSFVKDGSYLDGSATVANCYKSLWIYDDAALTITDASKDNNSQKILGNVKASYFSSLGNYRTIKQDGQRVTDFVETVECVVIER